MSFKLEKRNFSFKVFSASKLQIFPHLHSHIEIIFIKKDGKAQGFADEKTTIIEENDIFITFPNQVHYYEDIIKPMKAYVLLISPDICPEFKEIFNTQIPESPIFKNAGNNALILSSIKTLYDCSQNNEEYSDTLSRGASLILLSEIFKSVKLSKIQSKNTNILKLVVDYCYENYTNDISLQNISDEINVDRYYISRIFSQQLHIGFLEYINSLRIEDACRLLRETDSTITDICTELGFQSIRSFNRAFLRRVGITPTEYRRNGK